MSRLTDAGFPFSFRSGISLSLSLWQCPGRFLDIKHVGVIWFVFMFSNFYRLDLHNKNYGATFMQKPDWKSTSLDLVMVIKSAC